jgi:peptide deformylase
MIRAIRKIGDPVLRKKAKKVEKISKDTQKLLDDMIETMHKANGMGLAAPQVGISQRIAVVEVPKEPAGETGDKAPKNAGDTPAPAELVLYQLINPEVVKQSDDTWEHQEGCLSIPGWRGDVERPNKIVVRALDRAGNRVKIEAEGMLARALLHEIDHLDGVLYIDKLVSPDRVWRVDEDATEDAEG